MREIEYFFSPEDATWFSRCIMMEWPLAKKKTIGTEEGPSGRSSSPKYPRDLLCHAACILLLKSELLKYGPSIQTTTLFANSFPTNLIGNMTSFFPVMISHSDKGLKMTSHSRYYRLEKQTRMSNFIIYLIRFLKVWN